MQIIDTPTGAHELPQQTAKETNDLSEARATTENHKGHDRNKQGTMIRRTVLNMSKLKK